jgi:hypothetical protein
MVGEQARELQAALLSAFPTKDQLDELAWYGLSVSLDTIALDGPLPARVTKLLQWAESTNNLDALVRQATTKNPTNPDLIAYVAKWSAVTPQPRRRPVFPQTGQALLPQDFEQLVQLMNFGIGWFSILGLISLHLLGYASLPSVVLVMTTLLGAVWIFRRRPSRE